LGELKKLQIMLDEKGANYMAGFSNLRSSNEFESVEHKIEVKQLNLTEVLEAHKKRSKIKKRLKINK
jgi:hypothetical protein